MKILLIGAHSDDLDMTMGGTIAKLQEDQKNIIYCVILSDSSTIKENKGYDLRQECKESAIMLDINELRIARFETMQFTRDFQPIRDYIFQLKQELHPEVVFTTSPCALHPDHKRVGEAVESIFMESTIYGVEDIRGNQKQLINKWEKLEQRHIDKKIKAISAYHSQQKRPYYNFDQIVSVAKARGIQIGTQYAEGFESIRVVNK